jgi:hypothetical protein
VAPRKNLVLETNTVQEALAHLPEEETLRVMGHPVVTTITKQSGEFMFAKIELAHHVPPAIIKLWGLIATGDGMVLSETANQVGPCSELDREKEGRGDKGGVRDNRWKTGTTRAPRATRTRTARTGRGG